jgi:uncharacterized protein YdeI (YjbR/CyaY-like superfamily)
MPTEHSDGRSVVEPADLEAWREWLAENHESSGPVWVTSSKKDGRVASVSYLEARDEALCWGWIDSTVNRLDEHRYLTLFARRNPKSGWSKVNKERVAVLREQGRMREPGERAIAVAVENGSWTMLDAIEALEVPDDLAEAFEADPAARRGYDSMPDGMKKETLRRVVLAKRPETRRKWIERAIEQSRARDARVRAD